MRWAGRLFACCCPCTNDTEVGVGKRERCRMNIWPECGMGLLHPESGHRASMNPAAALCKPC